jgi:hypothetical protein
MIGMPERDEAPEYYFTYIDQVPPGDILGTLHSQVEATLSLVAGISEDGSLHRYNPGKWSIREVLSHINDAERVFVFRALWFTRGFGSPLPSFDQEIAISEARADERSWLSHLDEFRTIRAATLTFFESIPEQGWMRRGIANDNVFTVRALAYITAGHVTHHTRILRERYLPVGS